MGEAGGMTCCCRYTQYLCVNQPPYKQAGAFSSKSQAGSSSLLLLVPRGFLLLACLESLGNGIFFLSCSSCRNSCLDILPQPPPTPFPSQSPLPFPALLSSLFSKNPRSSFPLCLSYHSSTPLTKSCLGEQQRELHLQGLMAGEALVASCMVKCLLGMQSCEQPPSPYSPPWALCQWASICKAKLQSSLGNDVPAHSVLQVAGGWIHATPSQLSSHALWEKIAIPPLQLLPGERPGESPSQQKDAMRENLFLRGATVGSDQKGWIQMPGMCMGREEMASSLWSYNVAVQGISTISQPANSPQGIRVRELGCIRHVPSKTSVSLSKNSDPVSHRLASGTHQTAVMGRSWEAVSTFLQSSGRANSAHFWSQLLTLFH